MSSEEVRPGAHHTIIFDRICIKHWTRIQQFHRCLYFSKVFPWVVRLHLAVHSTELMINKIVLALHSCERKIMTMDRLAELLLRMTWKETLYLWASILLILGTEIFIVIIMASHLSQDGYCISLFTESEKNMYWKIINIYGIWNKYH